MPFASESRMHAAVLRSARRIAGEDSQQCRAYDFQNVLAQHGLKFGDPPVDRLLVLCSVDGDGNVDLSGLARSVDKASISSRSRKKARTPARTRKEQGADGAGGSTPLPGWAEREEKSAVLGEKLAANSRMLHTLYKQLKCGQLSSQELVTELETIGVDATPRLHALLRSTPRHISDASVNGSTSLPDELTFAGLVQALTDARVPPGFDEATAGMSLEDKIKEQTEHTHNKRHHADMARTHGMEATDVLTWRRKREGEKQMSPSRARSGGKGTGILHQSPGVTPAFTSRAALKRQAWSWDEEEDEKWTTASRRAANEGLYGLEARHYGEENWESADFAAGFGDPHSRSQSQSQRGRSRARGGAASRRPGGIKREQLMSYIRQLQHGAIHPRTFRRRVTALCADNDDAAAALRSTATAAGRALAQFEQGGSMPFQNLLHAFEEEVFPSGPSAAQGRNLSAGVGLDDYDDGDNDNDGWVEQQEDMDEAQLDALSRRQKGADAAAEGQGPELEELEVEGGSSSSNGNNNNTTGTGPQGYEYSGPVIRRRGFAPGLTTARRSRSSGVGVARPRAKTAGRASPLKRKASIPHRRASRGAGASVSAGRGIATSAGEGDRSPVRFRNIRFGKEGVLGPQGHGGNARGGAGDPNRERERRTKKRGKVKTGAGRWIHLRGGARAPAPARAALDNGDILGWADRPRPGAAAASSTTSTSTAAGMGGGHEECTGAWTELMLPDEIGGGGHAHARRHFKSVRSIAKAEAKQEQEQSEAKTTNDGSVSMSESIHIAFDRKQAWLGLQSTKRRLAQAESMLNLDANAQDETSNMNEDGSVAKVAFAGTDGSKDAGSSASSSSVASSNTPRPSQSQSQSLDPRLEPYRLAALAQGRPASEMLGTTRFNYATNAARGFASVRHGLGRFPNKKHFLHGSDNVKAALKSEPSPRTEAPSPTTHPSHHHLSGDHMTEATERRHFKGWNADSGSDKFGAKDPPFATEKDRRFNAFSGVSVPKQHPRHFSRTLRKRFEAKRTTEWNGHQVATEAIAPRKRPVQTINESKREHRSQINMNCSVEAGFRSQRKQFESARDLVYHFTGSGGGGKVKGTHQKYAGDGGRDRDGVQLQGILGTTTRSRSSAADANSRFFGDTQTRGRRHFGEEKCNKSSFKGTGQLRPRDPSEGGSNYDEVRPGHQKTAWHTHSGAHALSKEFVQTVEFAPGHGEDTSWAPDNSHLRHADTRNMGNLSGSGVITGGPSTIDAHLNTGVKRSKQKRQNLSSNTTSFRLW